MSETPPPLPKEVPSGWEGILEPGERILWQGSPARGFHPDLSQWRSLIPGALFAVFGIFWIYKTLPVNPIFALFGLAVIALPLNQISRQVLGTTPGAGRITYTLTDRRAVIATEGRLTGRRLETYPIGPDTELALDDSTPGTIRFSLSSTTDSFFERSRSSGPRQGSFARISDAREVFALMQQVRAGRAP